MKMMKSALVALTLCVAPAVAETIDLDYQGVAGGTGAMTLSVNGSQYYAGHMIHEVTSGPNAGSSFRTFCIELGEFAANGSATYDIVDLASAPAPGSPYGQAAADQVSAVLAAAVSLGWIDGKLQADSGQSDYLGKMGAIQAAIWQALGASIDVNSSQTSSELAFYYFVLTNPFSLDPAGRVDGLRAVVSPGQQDMLYVVPLPPAVFAGAGLLAVGFGVRTYRRR